MSMSSTLGFGIILGLSAGFSPGPLLAVVISQTLRHGATEGVKVATAPILTDLPIIGMVLLLFYNLSDIDLALGIASFAGAGLVLFLGLQNLLIKPTDYEAPLEPPRSYAKGVLVNALSPHPYLFWFSVGVPTAIKLAQETLSLSFAFLLSFFACLIGAKVLIALLVGRSRAFLSGRLYLWLMRGMGLALVLLSGVLLKDGLKLTGML